MTKIDHRISYKIVLDVETAPMDRTVTKVDASNMLVYDIGWAVVDKRGNVYETRSFINSDIYIDEYDIFKSAYYFNKLPQYRRDLKAGTRKLAHFNTIRNQFLKDVADYGIEEVYAHNAYFDYTSLNRTEAWLTKSAFRHFFPKSVTVCCTMKMAQQVVCNKPTYVRFCEEHGFLTNAGKPRKTAEALYRFISGDVDFAESHTGLEDVLIEKEIMAYCFRQHKAMKRNLFNN